MQIVEGYFEITSITAKEDTKLARQKRLGRFGVQREIALQHLRILQMIEIINMKFIGRVLKLKTASYRR